MSNTYRPESRGVRQAHAPRRKGTGMSRLKKALVLSVVAGMSVFGVAAAPPTPAAPLLADKGGCC